MDKIPGDIKWMTTQQLKSSGWGGKGYYDLGKGNKSKGLWVRVDGSGKAYDFIRLGNRIQNSNGDYVQLNSTGTITKAYDAKTKKASDFAKADESAMRQGLIKSQGTGKWRESIVSPEQYYNKHADEVEYNIQQNPQVLSEYLKRGLSREDATKKYMALQYNNYLNDITSHRGNYSRDEVALANKYLAQTRRDKTIYSTKEDVDQIAADNNARSEAKHKLATQYRVDNFGASDNEVKEHMKKYDNINTSDLTNASNSLYKGLNEFSDKMQYAPAVATAAGLGGAMALEYLPGVMYGISNPLSTTAGRLVSNPQLAGRVARMTGNRLLNTGKYIISNPGKATFEFAKDIGKNLITHPIQNATNMFVTVPATQYGLKKIGAPDWVADNAGFILGGTINNSLFNTARSKIGNTLVNKFNQNLASLTTQEGIDKVANSALSKILDFKKTNLGNSLLGSEIGDGSIYNVGTELYRQTSGLPMLWGLQAMTPDSLEKDHPYLTYAYQTALGTAFGKTLGNRTANWAERNTEGASDATHAVSGIKNNLFAAYNQAKKFFGKPFNQKVIDLSSLYSGYGTGRSIQTQTVVDPQKKLRGIVQKNQQDTFGSDPNFHSGGYTLEGLNNVLSLDASPLQLSRAVSNFVFPSNSANGRLGGRANWGINTSNSDFLLTKDSKALTHDGKGNLVEIPIFRLFENSMIVNPELLKTLGRVWDHDINAARSFRHYKIYNNDDTFNNIGGYQGMFYRNEPGGLVHGLFGDNWAYHRIGGTYGVKGPIVRMAGHLVDSGGNNVKTMYGFNPTPDILRFGVNIESVPSAAVKDKYGRWIGDPGAFNNYQNANLYSTAKKNWIDSKERQSFSKALESEGYNFSNPKTIHTSAKTYSELILEGLDPEQAGIMIPIKEGKYGLQQHLDQLNLFRKDNLAGQWIDKYTAKDYFDTPSPKVITYKLPKKKSFGKTASFDSWRTIMDIERKRLPGDISELMSQYYSRYPTAGYKFGGKLEIARRVIDNIKVSNISGNGPMMSYFKENNIL